MKIKGIKKLSKAVDTITRSIVYWIEGRVATSDGAIIDEGIVEFGILRMHYEDNFYMEHLRELWPDMPRHLSVYICTILHEVGHLVTGRFPEEPDREKLYSSNDFPAYYALPSEQAATAWAVQFMQERPFETDMYNDLINDAMGVFLNRNIE